MSSNDVVEALKETYRALSPAYAIWQNPELFERLRVPWEESRLLDFVWKVVNGTAESKYLFTGFTGSGKTVALRYLEQHIRAQGELACLYLRIPVRADVGLPYFVSWAAGEVTRAAERELGIEVPPGLLERVQLATSVVAQGRVLEKNRTTRSGGEGQGSGFVNGEPEQHQSTRRTRVEATSGPEDRTMLEALAALVQHVESADGRPLLLVIDDTDKIPNEEAVDLFVSRADLIMALPCRMIIAVHPELIHRGLAKLPKLPYADTFRLPLVRIATRSGHPDKKGRAAIREMIARRAPLELFEPAALERIIDCSAGIVEHAFRIAKEAVMRAARDERARVEVRDSEAGLDALKMQYRPLLGPLKLRERARAMAASGAWGERAVAGAWGEIDVDDVFCDLMSRLIVLEYWNDSYWFDVHPIVREILGISASGGEKP